MNKRQVVFVVLSICWMIMIFAFSQRPGKDSTRDSHFVGEIIGHVFHSDFDEWSSKEQETYLESIDHGVRKTAHATEFGILAALILGIFASGASRVRNYFFAWAAATAYAGTDEFHQVFIPNRAGMVTDVMIDSCGAIVMMLVIGTITAIYNRRKSN